MDLFLKCLNNRFTLCMVTFFSVCGLWGSWKTVRSLLFIFRSFCPVFNSIHSSFHQWMQDWLQHMLNSWRSVLLMKVLIHFFPKHTFAYLARWFSSAAFCWLSNDSHICMFHCGGDRCTKKLLFFLSFAPEPHFLYTLNSLQTSGSTTWKCFALSSCVGTTCFNLQSAMQFLRGAISECIKL